MLVPWIVKSRDLRRYIGRALDACKKGRIIFFYYGIKDERQLFSLCPVRDFEQRIAAARADLARGRFREVSLEK